jgi:hypothetical protein
VTVNGITLDGAVAYQGEGRRDISTAVSFETELNALS